LNFLHTIISIIGDTGSIFAIHGILKEIFVTTWKRIHLTLQYMVFIKEIYCNCINRQLILHYSRREYIIWVYSASMDYLYILQN